MRTTKALSLAVMLAFSAPALADEYVIMKVNGQDVSSSEVQALWEGLFPAGQAPALDTAKPDVRERVLRAVMAERLLLGEAQKSGVDKTTKFTKDLEEVKRKLLVKSFLDTKTTDSISDADVKKQYDAMATAMKDNKEVRARHILLQTEQEAKDAKKKIDSGKGFEDVAREMSKDPGSAKQGGDLGYFSKDAMVKEFADAAFAMKKGEVSGPVKSSFGYHIIKVEDIRKAPVPPYSELKEKIRAKLQEQKLNDYIAGLVKAAEVKTFDAKGKEVPFDRNFVEGAPSAPAAAAARADAATKGDKQPAKAQ